MTTYFVSSIVGSDNNSGTSASAPLASLQAAANVVKPGDTVQVMNGTYTAPAYGVALQITTSGTASAPIPDTAPETRTSTGTGLSSTPAAVFHCPTTSRSRTIPSPTSPAGALV